VVDWNVEYWRWYKDYKLYHGCQITSAIAEHLVFGKNVPRVGMQVDLSQSTRAKEYLHNYTFVDNTDETFQKKIRKILGAIV
jgi:hypothetical protein|tara:strand:- start:782 stop:1027 length:246 start_codon:yes stop_codon:yes gene_type:complete